MGLKDCLLSAVDQGAITRAEADDLASMFEEKYAQAKMTLGDEAAAKTAREALEKELRAEAIERKRRVYLQEAASRKNDEYLQGYRNVNGKADVFDAVLNLIEHYGFAGTSSIAGRSKAIVSLAHGELADVLSTFRRSRLSGKRFNKPALNDVVDEIMGAPSGKPEVKAMADAITSVFESLRQRFNAAGGSIGRLERYLPVKHDARAMLNAGRDAWKKFLHEHNPRGLAQMKDPLTGEVFTPARLDRALDAAFDAVTTDGWSKRAPSAQPLGRGALASQRAEHRFIQWQDGDAWRKYNEAFGTGDPAKAIFAHINDMARDIAALEILGPNPNGEISRLTQIVQTEAAKAIKGAASLYDAGSKTADSVRNMLNYIPWRIDSVYQYVRGRAVVSGRMATGFGDVRNFITSAVLGSASIVAAATDPFIDRAARMLSGLPQAKAFGVIAKTFSKATREEAVRSGVILDDFLHVLGDDARFAGSLGGGEWSKWLADRTMQYSALEPLTQARKHVFALDFQAAMADASALDFDALNPYLRRTMQGYGLDRTAWDVIRATKQYSPAPGSAGFIRPIDVANLDEGPALAKVQKLLGIDEADAAKALEQTRAGVTRIAEQYLEMILGQTERAVPSGTARARAFVSGGQPKGTFFGELLESGLQFKSFALSFTTLQLQAIAQEGGFRSARGGSYAAAIAISLTLGGGIAYQLKQIISGKDPHDMTDPKFWFAALQTGGGIGLLGDFLFADVNRHGHTLAEMLMGPTVGLASDVAKFTAGNVREILGNKKSNAAAEALNLAGRYTPVLSSLFATRHAYRTMFLDQLQYHADPEAHRKFRQMQQRLHKETGQGMFWPRGDALPARAPGF